jgi:hypothetical protein
LIAQRTEGEKVKFGVPWTCQLLRNKSNENLRKHCYVLPKERNRLLPIRQEAKAKVVRKGQRLNDT